MESNKTSVADDDQFNALLNMAHNEWSATRNTSARRALVAYVDGLVAAPVSPEGDRQQAGDAKNYGASLNAGYDQGHAVPVQADRGDVFAYAYECRQPFTEPPIWCEFFSRNKVIAVDGVRNVRPLFMAPATLEPRDQYTLTRSVIHSCPALTLPQSLVDKLGNCPPIIVLIGADDAIAAALLAKLNVAPFAPPSEAMLIRAFSSGYKSGHHDTVEGQYTDIDQRDMFTYHADTIADMIADGTLAAAPADPLPQIDEAQAAEAKLYRDLTGDVVKLGFGGLAEAVATLPLPEGPSESIAKDMKFIALFDWYIEALKHYEDAENERVKAGWDEFIAHIDSRLATAPVAPPVAPSGWRLVPEVATEEMKDAAEHVKFPLRMSKNGYHVHTWAAMIANAPALPGSTPDAAQGGA